MCVLSGGCETQYYPFMTIVHSHCPGTWTSYLWEQTSLFSKYNDVLEIWAKLTGADAIAIASGSPQFLPRFLTPLRCSPLTSPPPPPHQLVLRFRHWSPYGGGPGQVGLSFIEKLRNGDSTEYAFYQRSAQRRIWDCLRACCQGIHP